MQKNENRKFNWKAWAAIAAVLVFVLGGTLLTRDDLPARRTGRSSESTAADTGAYKTSAAAGIAGGAVNSYESYAYDADIAVEEAVDVSMNPDGTASSGRRADESAAREEKIIRSASFTLKTVAYDADLESLQQLTASVGGRVEHLSSSGDQKSGQLRRASLTLRIPSSRLDEFLAGAEQIGDVTAMTQEMEDVSGSYYDIQNRLETQQEKMKRLQSLMASAQDVSDLIEIESAIADTQYYIDLYSGNLKNYDSRVAYSSVSVSIQETRVTEITTVTLGQRILTGLQDSLEGLGEFLEDMLVFLVAALPWLAILGIVILIVRLIVKRRKR